MTNLPATIWRDPDLEVEFTSGTAQAIIDPQGEAILDTVGQAITDTGTTASYLQPTAWTEDDTA